jgi:23S rRNA (uracil1939-C5)-methyltransferase
VAFARRDQLVRRVARSEIGPQAGEGEIRIVTESNTQPERIQRNMVIENLRIEDLAYGGRGIARFGEFVLFVLHAVPGDVVDVRVTHRKPRYAEAVIEKLREPSPDRIVPPCPLFGTCGGCSWQNIPYSVQLVHKQRQALESLAHLGQAKCDTIRPIIASPDEWRYRNKMDYTFGSDTEGRPILGFHLPGYFDRIFEVRRCLLQPESHDAIISTMSDWARAKGLSSYNPRNHRGLLRHLILRHSVLTGETVAVLLTNDGELPDPQDLVDTLRRAAPGLKGFVWGLNPGRADVALMAGEKWRWGEPWIEEQLGDRRFRISALSFFQVNTHAAKLLYDTIREFVGEDRSQHRMFDAYCGTGSIGIYCADRVKEVVGVEIIREAIWDARDNASRNGLNNCTFIAGEMRDSLPVALQMPGGRFGIVVVDPPRGGMDKRSLRGLLEIGAERIVYVSCNPSTLARDLVDIVEAGYRPSIVQPVDLFPQTFHIETVVRFDKR